MIWVSLQGFFLFFLISITLYGIGVLREFWRGKNTRTYVCVCVCVCVSIYHGRDKGVWCSQAREVKLLLMWSRNFSRKLKKHALALVIIILNDYTGGAQKLFLPLWFLFLCSLLKFNICWHMFAIFMVVLRCH